MNKKKEIVIDKKYKIAKSSDQKIDRLQQIASISYLFLGAELKKIKEEKLYKYLGEGSPEYETFEFYIKSKNMELRKAYYLMQIHTVFVEDLKFEPEELSGIHWTALRVLLPCVREENAQDLIEKAKILTRSHLETEIKQLKSGIHSLKDLEEHEHEWERIIFYQCRTCGERTKIKPESGKFV